MDQIDRLAKIFADFPGIGARQSRRFVFHLLNRPQSVLDDLADEIRTLKRSIRECTGCRRYFMASEKSVDGRCTYCADLMRDTATLAIVERDADLDALEKGGYRGRYFVLGGTLPMLEKEPERKIRTRELVERIDALAPLGLREIILAFAVTPESEHTADHIRTILADRLAESGIALSTLGRGLSTGSELEYADPDTVRWALERRT
ncbi:MAG TPA: toprim domain-containing protein [Candidatus Paceibacterota bacterium]|nr:toprim domain-containing protein [Candidatus Paceibacterota bacterium]